jgi:hypothetical protein
MLSNTFIVSEFVEILYSFPTWSCVKMCHKVPRPVTLPDERYWSCYRMTHFYVKYTGRGTIWHNARWNTLVVVPYDTLPVERHWSWSHMTHCQVRGTGRVNFNWQCVIRYNYQCISPGNVSCGTTTSVFHLAMCYTVPQPMYFTWQFFTHCQVKGTGRVSVWHIAMWNTLVVVPYDTLPVARHWSWYHMTHCQVRGTGRDTVWHILTHDHVGNEYKISAFLLIEIYFCYWIHRHVITCFNLIGLWFVTISNRHTKTSPW